MTPLVDERWIRGLVWQIDVTIRYSRGDSIWLNRVEVVVIIRKLNTCYFPLINLGLRLCSLSNNLNSICSGGIFLLLHHRDEAALMSNQQQWLPNTGGGIPGQNFERWMCFVSISKHFLIIPTSKSTIISSSKYSHSWDSECEWECSNYSKRRENVNHVCVEFCVYDRDSGLYDCTTLLYTMYRKCTTNFTKKNYLFYFL